MHHDTPNRPMGNEPIMPESNEHGDVEMPLLNGPGDLEAAWAAAEHSADPESLRHRIVTIAFNNQWEGSLPRAARDWAGTHGLGAADDLSALGGVLPVLPKTDGNLRPGGL